jgi:hypothetical protein
VTTYEIWTVPPPWLHSAPRRVERRAIFETREAAEAVAAQYEKRAHKNAFEVREYETDVAPLVPGGTP